MASTITPAQQLSLQESAQGDYTHKIIVTKADLVAAGAVNTIVLTFENPVVVGKVVSNPAVFIVTPFTFSDGTILTGTVSIGDSAAPTTYLAASNVQGVGATTPVLANVAYAAAVTKAYAAASNLNLTVTVTAAKNLSTCTAGEMHIFWQERNLTELCYPTQ